MPKQSRTDRLRAADAEFVPNVTLKQLSYFVAAARHQSVLRAAQALGISSPSVSAAIADLEAVVGAQLFVRRHARGLVLTQAGRDLAVDARNILIHSREIETPRSLGRSAMQGRLDIGCLLSFAPLFLPPLLRGFSALYPQVEIRWREGDQESLVEGLEKGIFDIAFLYDFELASTIQATALREMPPQVVLPAGHRLAPRKSIRLGDLKDEPFVLLDLPRTRHYLLSILSDAGVEPRAVHRAQSYEMVRSLVANGFGYAILNFCPPYAYAADGGIVSRPVEGRVRVPNLVLARLYQYKAPKMVEEFLGFSKRFAKALRTTAEAVPAERRQRRARGA
ncbi:MAG: LysR family transcriptional regulator [Candidatus Eiseniibacteriota bacterium]